CAYDGVETQAGAADFLSARYSILGFSTRSRPMLKRVPPVIRLQYKSITDRSNENGAVFRKISPRGMNFCSSSIQATKCSRHPSVMTTPFGSPVLPLVNKI